jgi:hypothetical protein
VALVIRKSFKELAKSGIGIGLSSVKIETSTTSVSSGD